MYYGFNNSLIDVLCQATENPVCQDVLASQAKRRFWLTWNPNLTDDCWWKLARTKLNRDAALHLYWRKLDPEQLEHALKDPRAASLSAVIQSNDISPETVMGILERPKQYSSVDISLSAKKGIPVEALDIILPRLKGWYWSKAVLSQEQIPAEKVAGYIATLPSTHSIRLVKYRWLGELLNTRPELPIPLISSMISEKSLWANAPYLQVMSEVCQSQHFKGDMWKLIQSDVGVKPKYSQPMARLMCAIIGNPNTSKEGVDWANDTITPWLKRLGCLYHRVSVVLEARANAGDPVTSGWDAILPKSESVTLKALREHGVLDYYWHPRVDRIEFAPQEPEPQQPAPTRATGRIPVQMPASNRGNWQEQSVWRTAIATVPAYIDTALKDAPRSVWENLVVLMVDWEGDVNSLIETASTL
jgi:hypothetical protein